MNDPLINQLRYAVRDIVVGREDWSRSALSLPGTVHDWRNYVPEILEQNWASLTERERLIVALITNVAASREEWD